MISSGPGLTMPVSGRDHSSGPVDAPVTLLQYGDFECPACGAAYPVIKEIQREMGDQLQFVYRNFPLTAVHPHAEAAAEAAEAAAAQGDFWGMHDKLYEHQRNLGNIALRKYAEQLGLDTARFERELTGRAYEARVQEDFMSGVRSGVSGTPTFFVNGSRFTGNWRDGTLLDALWQVAAG
jgi:protein-disulfide isomerase